MFRTKILISFSTACIIFSIHGCGTPSPTPTPTASPTATPMPTPVPTATPVPDNVYDFPLKVNYKGECNLGDHTAFEVKTDKTFWFLSDDKTRIESRALTNVEYTSLKNLLEEIDLAKLAESDQQLPPGSPQTDECRNVEYYSMKVNNTERTFDYNARLVTHSTEYIAALEKLRVRLNELKSTTVPQSYDYSLPLKVTTQSECGDGSVSVTHDIKADGTYSYNNGTSITTKTLTDDQSTNLDNLLEELDIAKKAEDDTVIPPNSPQTTECRTIERYIMQVNQTERTFDYNSRQLGHTQEYRTALETLKARLESLKD